jgi:hypothetical protein
MGYFIMMGSCIMCKQPFAFNPHKVPSIRVDGKREPLCLRCHGRANEVRKARGLEPWPDPQPGAYDGADESEL